MWTFGLKFASYASSGSAVALLAGLSHSQSLTACTSKDNANKRELLALYLKPESKVTVDKLLASRGKKNTNAQYVCIGSNLSENQSYVHKPLYGEKAAFRLKGIIETKDGDVVGVGRVSTMVGELRVEGQEVCLPLVVKDPAGGLQTALDLPTRLAGIKGVKELPFFRGHIPMGVVAGRRYSAVGATYVPLPLAAQVVVDGFLCSSEYVDKEGNCLFDRSAEITLTPDSNSASVSTTTSTNSGGSGKSNKDTAPPSASKSANSPQSPATDSDASSSSKTAGAGSEDECPVCRYMKAGPCRDHFLAWDACVTGVKDDEELTKCFQATAAMMACMKDCEYYDIMTAGMDFSKLPADQQAKHTVAEV